MSVQTKIIYGKSKEGKTSELARIANYYYNTHGYKSRLISADGGGWRPFHDYGLIDDNNPVNSTTAPVQVFDIRARDHAFAELKWLRDGYWPRSTKTGDIYFKRDEHCATDWKGKHKDIQLYLIEGTSGISELWLNHMRDTGQKIGTQNHSYYYEEEGYEMRGIGEAHYGVAQMELFKLFVQGFHLLPIKHEIVTGLLGTSENRKGDEKQYGPKAAGQAATGNIPAWFSECYHFDTVDKVDSEGVNKKVRVMWFVDHYDSITGLKYPCSAGMAPELLEGILSEYPEGYVERGFTKGVEEYFKRVDEVKNLYLEAKRNNKQQQELVNTVLEKEQTA